MASTQCHDSLSPDVARHVELLKRQYLQLVDPERLKMPPMGILRLPEAQAKIFDHMFNDKLRSFPSPKRYQFRVLKRIVDAVELSIVDPEQDVGSFLSLMELGDLFLFCLSRQYIASLTTLLRTSQMI